MTGGGTQMEPVTPKGIKTTEFWLTAASMIISLVYMSGVLVDGSAAEKGVAMVASALVALGYNISRGIAKKAP